MDEFLIKKRIILKKKEEKTEKLVQKKPGSMLQMRRTKGRQLLIWQLYLDETIQISLLNIPWFTWVFELNATKVPEKLSCLPVLPLGYGYLKI